MVFTSRMRWRLPAKDVDPWYDPFVDLMNAADADAYAAREDRNIVCMGGGLFTFAAGVLSWASTIELFAANTGFLWKIPAGSVALADGQMFYVELVRAPTDNVTLATAVAANLSVANGAAALVLGIRRGTRVYFRQGGVLQEGGAGAVFESGTLGSVGERIRRDVAVALNANTSEATFQVVGNFSLDPANYALGSTTREIRFSAIGFVTNSATAGEVRLFNLTDSAIVSTLGFTGVPETTPTRKQSGVLALPAAEKMYEVRIRVTGGTPPTDKVFAMWAGLQIDNLF